MDEMEYEEIGIEDIVEEEIAKDNVSMEKAEILMEKSEIFMEKSEIFMENSEIIELPGEELIITKQPQAVADLNGNRQSSGPSTSHLQSPIDVIEFAPIEKKIDQNDHNLSNGKDEQRLAVFDATPGTRNYQAHESTCCACDDCCGCNLFYCC